jgi:protease-4
MGTVAASGGYYIAADADEIWATPSTITGSIGVFAVFPTFEDLLQRVGVHTDGVGTTNMAGSLRADRPLNPELVTALNSSVDFAYETFLQVVSQGRDLSIPQLDPLAEGRVWAAEDALQYGLIDNVGSLQDAVAAAARLAGVADYGVEYVEMPLSPRDMLMKQLARSVGSLNLWTPSTASTALSGLLGSVRDAVDELGSLQDPANLYMRCISCGAVR